MSDANYEVTGDTRKYRIYRSDNLIGQALVYIGPDLDIHPVVFAVA